MNTPAFALPVILALSLSNAFAFADTTITGFESGIPSGWTTTGTAWTVGGTASIIDPSEGDAFARSGAPNVSSGALAESLTGTLTSLALKVSYEAIQFRIAGWSGSSGNGLDRFEILDKSLNAISTISAPQSDSWITYSVNLVSLGLSAGDTFYIRAVDASSASSYSWLAIDDINFAGHELQVSTVPEPDSLALTLVGLVLCSLRLRRQKEQA
jgi:hypothetical protein